MMMIRIYNPYFDKTYRVAEDKGTIECALVSIGRGDKGFLHLHDLETGNAITISPKNCASMEIFDEGEE